MHGLVLLLLLAALVPFVGPTWSWSADEGAVLAQANHLADGRGWLMDVPSEEIDPDGTWFPLHLSERADDGRWATYTKLPLYPLVVAGALRVGGMPLVVLLGVVATAVAAVATGALAGLARRSLARPTLWLTALATPLLFDSFQVIAHSLGAAAVAVGALALAHWRRSGRPVHLVLVAGCAAGAVALRNEGFFLVLATCIVLAAMFSASRERRDLVACGVVGLAGCMAFAGNRLAHQAIMGGAGTLAAPSSSDSTTFLSGRWSGFYQTWLEPNGRPTLVLGALFVAGAAVACRRRRPAGIVVELLLAGALVAVAVGLAAQPMDTISGLLVVSPIIVFGLVAVRRSNVQAPLGAAVAVFILFAGAVLATQYRKGGSGEWGGRYFAIGLPLLMPLVAAGALGALQRLDRDARRIVGGLLAAMVFVLGAASLVTLHKLHAFNGRVIENAVETAASTSAGDGGRPIVVSTLNAVPRLAWRQVPDDRWFLAASQTELMGLFERLASNGISEVTVAVHPDHGIPEIPGWEAVRINRSSDGVPAVVYERRA
jgi:hypothetical protein